MKNLLLVPSIDNYFNFVFKVTWPSIGMSQEVAFLEVCHLSAIGEMIECFGEPSEEGYIYEFIERRESYL